MSRFDDDLRRATAPLAREALPDDVLDEALDEQPRRAWPRLAAAVAAGMLVAVTAGIGFGELLPAPSPSASPSASESPSPSAPTGGACENVSAPAGGNDVVAVYFPCGDGFTATARPVEAGLDAEARLRVALEDLLNGPSELEASYGLGSVVPAGSADLLSGVSVAPDGLAQVDFASRLRSISNLSTSAASAALIGAIRETALGLDEVTAVELRIDGSCDDFFAFLQAACQHLAEPVGEMSDCPIIPPAELPSGAPVTEPRPHPTEPMVSWGSGPDTVTELPGHRDAGGDPPPGATPITIRGLDGYAIPAGDLPSPPPFELGWTEDGCSYRVWITLGEGMDAAVAYAARFGPAVAEPSPPPAQPVTATNEENGIRVTLTLDRDRTTYGQRVHADVTVTNTGTDTVHWGHSGTCDFAAGVGVTPTEESPMPYGREDWTGDLELLKQLAVDPDFTGIYGFEPIEWIDFEGMWGCTTDFVMDEVAPGEVLTYRAAWDTDGAFGMPPVPGTYRVEATFGYLSRGAPPPMDSDPPSLRVSAEVPLTVEGDGTTWVPPGHAMDAILEDASFVAELEDAPRGRWTSHSFAFEDGAWIFSLYLTETDRDSEVVEAIVARVDARSGEVTSVDLVEGAQPPPGG